MDEIQECEFRNSETSKCRNYCTRHVVLSNLANVEPVHYYFCGDHVQQSVAVLAGLGDLISLRVEKIKGWTL